MYLHCFYGDEIMFFCQLQSPNHGTVKVLGFVVVWAIFTFDFFKIETYLLDTFLNDMFFGGGGALLTPGKVKETWNWWLLLMAKGRSPKWPVWLA